MALPRLTKLELQVMDALWTRGASSVREIQEAFPEKDRPAYTTVQTMVYRLEGKKAIRRLKKIGNAHIFEVDDVVAEAVDQHQWTDIDARRLHVQEDEGQPFEDTQKVEQKCNINLP